MNESSSGGCCPLDTLPLEELMARYQSIGPEAGAELVRRLSPGIFQYFLAQLRSRPAAEDLLQDFWLRLHNARHTYRPPDPVMPWAFAIARRVKIDDFRRNRRSRDYDQLDEGMVAAPQKKDSVPMSDLLRDLPESQRQVLILTKVNGLSLEEVARALGCSVGSVKQKAHRAYERLRRCMKEQRA